MTTALSTQPATPQDSSTVESDASYPWTPDNGDGTFCNPILQADYSDPDIVRVGADFYLISSSFNCTPGLPILHSRDLVNWTIIGHAITNLPHERYREVQLGAGVWAPAIRYHEGKFWIFFPLPDEGIYVTTAEDPAGPWSRPWCLLEGKGFIDPCPLWDEDGRAYLILAFARSRCGIKHRLSVYPMSWDGTAILGEGQIVYENEAKHPTLEGPKWLKRNGYYYILAPAGGVKTGWQVAFRSRQIFGPYEDKIVLRQGQTAINGPHQGGLVDLPNGDWWFVHFQDDYVYGRIVHLQPVLWRDGWPLMGEHQDEVGCGQPVLRHAKPSLPAQAIQIPQTTDFFQEERLGAQWQWEANHETSWYSLAERPGHLRLRARPLPGGSLRRAPHVLGQKFPAKSFRVQCLVESSAATAGLTIMGQAHASLSVEAAAEGHVVRYREGDEVLYATPAQSALITLAVEVRSGGVCQFSWKEADIWHPVPGTFQAKEGHWIGARVGIYCAGDNGHADFTAFQVLPSSTVVQP